MDLEDVIRKKHAGDDEQLEFIFSDAPKIVVTAPAGCGKTTAMISKIVREVCLNNTIGYKKILAITFSVNAAIRIKDSVKELLPDIVDDPRIILSKIDVANYHNFAMRLLYKYGYVLNDNFRTFDRFLIIDDETVINEGFLVFDDVERFKELDSSIRRFQLEKLNDSIDKYWDILNDNLIEKNIITYNGIIVAAIKLLSISTVSHFYTSYYQMVIIDEFQDTNLICYLLVKKLFSNNKVIFLGDSIQKIYGYLGAIDDAFRFVSKNYTVKNIVFKNNYRFKDNERMKHLDRLVRDYVDKYKPSALTASLLIKKLKTDRDEVDFICNGIKRIIKNNSDVAVLVRSRWQGEAIINKLKDEQIEFFNALYLETDAEYIKFYNVVIEEFQNNVSGKAVKCALDKCLKAVKKREFEIYNNPRKKYIFDSLYKLLNTLFKISRTWYGTSRDRYINIDFTLRNKGLKHMLQYLDEKVILTTIHAAKGLEWDYVIIPQMNAGIVPSWSYVCKICHSKYGYNEGGDYCENKFIPDMEKILKEEMRIYYVALTRAKKDVFITANTGENKYNYNKRTNCFINLPGLKLQEFEWSDYF